MLIDICANLLSDCYKVPPHNCTQDIEHILYRASLNGVIKIILCCSTLEETKEALKLCSKFSGLYCTLGIHPMSIPQYKDVPWDTIKTQFTSLALEHHYPKGHLIAFGEMGLDSFRKEYVDLKLQEKYFRLQLQLVIDLNLDLPILFHCRQSSSIFTRTINEFNDNTLRGVVHSFSDSFQDLEILLSTNFYIGLNGVAFREQETVEAIKSIPFERVMLETDSPYCRISKSYFGHSPILDEKFEDKCKKYKTKKKYKVEDKEFLMKGRNEPCKVVEVYNAFCNLVGVDKNEVEKTIERNCNNLFWNK
eukprot:GAHX01001428.1.p1 GENE.GAHX01001428.1~~GAHX01001428.1.p1  ORF type:complete len:320 (+),score=47.67 GAHX01001428.1:45-962(+)